MILAKFTCVNLNIMFIRFRQNTPWLSAGEFHPFFARIQPS